MIELDFRRRLGPLLLQVQVSVPSQGITAVFGRSGSGKTSLINAVAGLLRPDEGRIRVEQRVFFDAAARVDIPMEQRGIGYVFQDARLFPHLSVAGNLRYGLKRSGRTAAIGFDAVVEVLGIAPLLHRRPHALSGGERQRVALGRALLRQPTLLLMDEPLAALDAPRKTEVLPYIERLCHEFHLPALYVSHSVDEITRLAQHLVIVSEGRTVACGELTEVMSEPEHAPLIGRFEAGVVIDCRVARHDVHYQLSTLAFADGELRVPLVDLPEGTSVRARLRARDVALSLSTPTDLSLSNRLHGAVVSMTPREGPYVDVAIGLGSTVVRALVTRESCDRLGLAVGQPAWAMVKSVALDSRSVGFARRPRPADGSAA
ncbi:molybdenum ABC transporter ATP-binding protein [Schlegelella sp. S2-27]|uniref:Molybdenum ABC transporter ATP-binding protein n=1 Tax=Caldimonas mangrovi TaxID=2944811 RepID=A0ABT0YL99_9BURK|nr:molybdenum ABC transporter ATP-binding protein [Caldimonas mangrovi]MCM5679438.1 molybdenum ABC transporter ATP-binding protein [Caldimonas mangrovi]